MTEQQPTFVIMPVMSGLELTRAAVSDVLAQSVPVRLLLIGQACSAEIRSEFERLAEEDERVLTWWHSPTLPSLAATWNRALRFVWEAGGTEALVSNHDVRLHRDTVRVLKVCRPYERAWFITAVGVTAAQFDPDAVYPTDDYTAVVAQKGGPDFSCYLITREGHEKYPFDEGMIPCYGEDCDLHRRFMLGGDGDRIFSINLPFHHIGGGSQTLKAMTPEKRAARERLIGQSREYYARKWGPINQERFTIPFNPASAQDGVTNPDLQRAIQGVLA